MNEDEEMMNGRHGNEVRVLASNGIVASCRYDPYDKNDGDGSAVVMVIADGPAHPAREAPLCGRLFWREVRNVSMGDNSAKGGDPLSCPSSTVD